MFSQQENAIKLSLSASCDSGEQTLNYLKSAKK